MQRESAKRGFVLSSQKVVLNVDLAGHLRGYTEIIIVPTNRQLRTIHLHSRQCDIHGVTVGGQTADFSLMDPFTNLAPSKPDDVHSIPELKRKLYSALSEADEGELSIAIPNNQLPNSIPQVGAISLGVPTGARFATPDPGFNSSEFAPIMVVIEYSLHNPHDGLQFVLPTDAYPYVRNRQLHLVPSG